MRSNLVLTALTITALSMSQIAFAGPIHEAAKAGNIDEIKRLAHENSDHLNERDESGMTALHWATANQQTQAVTTLLNLGSAVDVKNLQGEIPLQIAKQRKNPEIAQALFEAAPAAMQRQEYTAALEVARLAEALLSEKLIKTFDDLETNPNTPEDMKVILYINVFSPEDPAKESDSLFEDFKKRMKKLFPERRIHRVDATTSEELKGKLDHLLNYGERISHLVLGGHGSSYIESFPGQTLAYARTAIGSEGHLEYFHPTQDSNIPPEQLENMLRCLNGSSMRLLSGIRSCYTEDPQVLITSCELLTGSQEEAEAKAKGIAHVLGIRNGKFYANRTIGTQYPEFIPWLKRFTASPSLRKVGLGVGGLSLGIGGLASFLGCSLGGSAILGATPLTLLYAGSVYNHYYFHNQGYRCEVKDGKVQIFPSSKYQFEKSHFEVSPSAPLQQ